MSRNFRCTVGVAIVYLLLMLDVIFFFFMGLLFFNGLMDMHYGWIESGWDVRFERGIAKMFWSLNGFLAFFGIAAGLLKAEAWLCRWKAGKA